MSTRITTHDNTRQPVRVAVSKGNYCYHISRLHGALCGPRFCRAALISLLLVEINSANSQTVDFVVGVVTGISAISADYKVEIVDRISAINADQKWSVVGVCSNSPSVRIEIVEGISAISADFKVEIVTGIAAINADKKVCISGADQLGVDLLLKLVE